MKKRLAYLILSMIGWKLVGNLPVGLRKAVIIVAPHTSNWDFFIGYLAYVCLGVKAKFLMKKEIFVFPIASIAKKLGGIAVNRNEKNTIVEDVVKAINNSDDFILTITPEGTRSKVMEWKSGFWRIAKMAEIPVIVGFLDFKEKKVGILGAVKLTDNYEDDLGRIQNMYRNISGLYPDKFYLPPTK